MRIDVVNDEKICDMAIALGRRFFVKLELPISADN